MGGTCESSDPLKIEWKDGSLEKDTIDTYVTEVETHLKGNHTDTHMRFSCNVTGTDACDETLAVDLPECKLEVRCSSLGNIIRKHLYANHKSDSRRRRLVDDPSYRTLRPIERLAHEISVA